jgi:hypothetical protein
MSSGFRILVSRAGNRNRCRSLKDVLCRAGGSLRSPHIRCRSISVCADRFRNWPAALSSGAYPRIPWMHSGPSSTLLQCFGSLDVVRAVCVFGIPMIVALPLSTLGPPFPIGVLRVSVRGMAGLPYSTFSWKSDTTVRRSLSPFTNRRPHRHAVEEAEARGGEFLGLNGSRLAIGLVPYSRAACVLVAAYAVK